MTLASAASLILATVAAGVLTIEPTDGAAESPDPILQGAERLAVYCRTNTPELEQYGLCNRVQALAAERTRLPVAVLAPGDPELLAPRTLALLGDFAVQPGEAGPRLVFTLRLYRHGGEPSLFGSRPRAAALPTNGASPTLDEQLRGALTEILPGRDIRRPPGRP